MTDIKLQLLVQNFKIDSILADLDPARYAIKFWLSYAELTEYFTRVKV